jgi:hypothetical protein
MQNKFGSLNLYVFMDYVEEEPSPGPGPRPRSTLPTTTSLSLYYVYIYTMARFVCFVRIYSDIYVYKYTPYAYNILGDEKRV